MLIYVIKNFEPFDNGDRRYVGLQFDYDAWFIGYLKSILRQARDDVVYEGPRRKNVGGWIAAEQAWFVHADVWDYVRYELIQNGHHITVEGDTHV